jgi:hypothetical protein
MNTRSTALLREFSCLLMNLSSEVCHEVVSSQKTVEKPC